MPKGLLFTYKIYIFYGVCVFFVNKKKNQISFSFAFCFVQMCANIVPGWWHLLLLFGWMDVVFQKKFPKISSFYDFYVLVFFSFYYTFRLINQIKSNQLYRNNPFIHPSSIVRWYFWYVCMYGVCEKKIKKNRNQEMIFFAVNKWKNFKLRKKLTN